MTDGAALELHLRRSRRAMLLVAVPACAILAVAGPVDILARTADPLFAAVIALFVAAALVALVVVP